MTVNSTHVPLEVSKFTKYTKMHSCFKELKYSTIVSNFPVRVMLACPYMTVFIVLILADAVVTEPILGKDGH